MLYSEIKNNTELISEVTVKSYLPIILKRAIIHGINNEDAEIDGLISTCIELKDSMYYVNYARLTVSKFFLTISLYTDIVFDTDSMFDAYDFFMENNLYDIIASKISDLAITDKLIDMEIKQYLDVRNSLSFVVARSIDKALEKMPSEESLEKFFKKIPSLINKIKPENLEVFKEMIAKKI